MQPKGGGINLAHHWKSFYLPYTSILEALVSKMSYVFDKPERAIGRDVKGISM